jgi:hypothetical protein
MLNPCCQHSLASSRWRKRPSRCGEPFPNLGLLIPQFCSWVAIGRRESSLRMSGLGHLTTLLQLLSRGRARRTLRQSFARLSSRPRIATLSGAPHSPRHLSPPQTKPHPMRSVDLPSNRGKCHNHRMAFVLASVTWRRSSIAQSKQIPCPQNFPWAGPSPLHLL